MSTVYPNRVGSDLAGASSASNESSVSAASWAAIFAGAVAAVATSLILIALGSGIGFASVSVWPYNGTNVTTFAITTAIWLIVVQWGSSLLGGYITGRLRTKWVGTHTHEVFFRDTAHGFVTWALATVISALVLTNAAAGVAGKGAQAASMVMAGSAQGIASSGSAQPSNGSYSYDVDKLFRPASPSTAGASKQTTHEEAARILANGLATGEISTEDRSYLVSEVTAQTGVSQEEAQRRVDSTIAATKAAELKARQVADDTRKALARTSIFLALSMLIGAFIAAAAAAVGGRLRDAHP